MCVPHFQTHPTAIALDDCIACVAGQRLTSPTRIMTRRWQLWSLHIWSFAEQMFDLCGGLSWAKPVSAEKVEGKREEQKQWRGLHCYTILHVCLRQIAIWSLSHQTMGLLFVGRQEHYIFVPCIDTKNRVWKTTPISQRDKLHLETQHVSIGI